MVIIRMYSWVIYKLNAKPNHFQIILYNTTCKFVTQEDVGSGYLGRIVETCVLLFSQAIFVIPLHINLGYLFGFRYGGVLGSFFTKRYSLVPRTTIVQNFFKDTVPVWQYHETELRLIHNTFKNRNCVYWNLILWQT